ncbi:MAG: peptidoglycan-binding domain-containing protein [Pseudomonadota bacterium]
MALNSARLSSFQRLHRAAENDPPLRTGDRGFPIAVVQHCFVDLGHRMPRSQSPDGAMDGVFGGETGAAARDFQTKHGLSVDGVVGRQTLSTLDTLFDRTAGITRHRDLPSAEPTGPPPEGWDEWPPRRISTDQRDTIARILSRDPAVRRIDFSLGAGERIHLTGDRLSYVGDLIRSGQIPIYTSYNLARAGYGGLFSPATNMMVFDFKQMMFVNSTDFEKRHNVRSSIVHEAAHAAIDLGRRRILASWDEAAAYIVGHIYLRHYKASWIFTPFLKHRAAADIVTKHKLDRKAGVHLERHDIRKLLEFTRSKKWWARGPGNAGDTMPKSDAAYRPSPKGGQYCARCLFFVAGGTCKLVAGDIRPDGHCVLFAA